MTIRTALLHVTGALILTVVSGCTTGYALPEDPCADANRPVTFENLFENSALGTYERCLQETRAAAVEALGK